MKLPQEILENVQIIFNSACTLHNLLDNVLDFNKIESGNRKLQLKPLNLHSVLSNAIKVFQATAKSKGKQKFFSLLIFLGISLFCHISDFLRTNKVEVDELCLSQILTNLVNNSVKFTDKGSVTVTATETAISDKKINLSISVEDTGIGISEENCTKLFHEFVQVENSAKYGGTGLGLAICKQLVEMMGI